jgi:ribosomal protein L37AE/L43A
MKIRTTIGAAMFMAGLIAAVFLPHFGFEIALVLGILLMVAALVTLLWPRREYESYDTAADVLSREGDGKTCAICHHEFTERRPDKGFGICEKCDLEEQTNLLNKKLKAKQKGSNQPPSVAESERL